MGVGEIAQEEYIGKTGRKKTIMGESPRNTHMSRWGRGKKPEEEGPEREKENYVGGKQLTIPRQGVLLEGMMVNGNKC